MRVDEPGHQHPTTRVDAFACRRRRIRIDHRDDLLLHDDDGGVLAQLLVHAIEDSGVHDDEIGVGCMALRDAEHRQQNRRSKDAQ